ncbi:RalA-binding protein 1 [Nymphon striatum]|nr:RalA-binding protein 1 [Nymphon striatum]
MDFESPDVAKDFPGLYASENIEQIQDSESDDDHEKLSKKELLIGKRKDKKDSKKDKGYVAFEGESSDENMDDSKSPTKTKKSKTAFKFPGPKKDKSKEKSKDSKDSMKKEKDFKESKKESKELKKEKEKEVKENKKEKESKESKKDKDKESKKEKEKEIKESKKGKEKEFKESKKEKEKEFKEKDRCIFGVPLQVAVERNKCHDGIALPAIIRECVDYIEMHGLSCEGIYRLSGVKSKVQQIKQQYNNGEKVYLYEHEPHIVASVLKLFMRELPEPVLTDDLNQEFEDASALKSNAVREEKLQALISLLPNPNRLLLSWVFVHMQHVIAREPNNKMSLQNVAIVLSPTMQISHRVLNALFNHANVLFKDVEIKKYLSLELPDSPLAIEEELKKQESLLNQLHEEEVFIDTRLQEVENDKMLMLMLDADADAVADEDADAEVSNSKHTEEPISETSKEHVIENETSQNESTAANSKNNEPEISEAAVQNICQSNVNNIENDEIVENEDVSQKEESTVKENSPASLQPEACENLEEKDAELLLLIQEEKRVRLEYNEMKSLGEDLYKKIESERSEAERLLVEVNALHKIYRYRQVSFDSDSNSTSSSNSSDSINAQEDEDELIQTLDMLERESEEYTKMNLELIKLIQEGREACMSVKVEIRIIHDNANHISVC